MTAIDLSKQEALTPDSKAIQEINFNGNLERQEQYFSLMKKQKKLFKISAKNYKSNVTFFTLM